MKQSEFEIRSSRRSFLKKGALTGAAVVGAGLFGASKVAFGQYSGGSLTKGDIAILRFLAAAELIESDLWTQYAELGGLTPGQVPPEVNPNQPLNPIRLPSRTSMAMPSNISAAIPTTKSATPPSSTPTWNPRGRGSQPRSISDPSWQPSNACIGIRGTVPHQPHAPQRRYQLVSSAIGARPTLTLAPLFRKPSPSLTAPPSPGRMPILRMPSSFRSSLTRQPSTSDISNKAAQVCMRRLARKSAVWKCSKSLWVSAETRSHTSWNGSILQAMESNRPWHPSRPRA